MLFLNSLFSPAARALESNLIDPELVVLQTGSSHFISAPKVYQLHVSTGNIVKVKQTPTGFRVFAKKAGQVQLTGGGQNWFIRVLDKDDYTIYQHLLPLSSLMLGPQLDLLQNQWWLKGEIFTFADWQELKQIFVESHRHFRLQAQVTDEALNELKSFLKQTFAADGLDMPSLRLSPSGVAIIPPVGKDKLELYTKSLQPFGFEVSVAQDQIEIKPLIRVKVYMAEINKNFQQQMGLLWPSSYQTQVLPATTEFNPLAVQLNALETSGNGKLLANPTLVSRSGETAEFLAGGEFPIKTKGFRTTNVSWKQHGILLKIKPSADSKGHLRVDIDTEISLIDPSVTIDGIPGLKTNRISSKFDLKQSKIICLSGLLRESIGNSSEGLPWLSQVPILGYLFSSKDYLYNRSELFVFVHPEIITDEASAP